MSPSAYITPYVTVKGKRRYRVEYRTGGRSSVKQHAGSFKTKALAEARRAQVAMALARGEDPRETVLAPPKPVEVLTLAEATRRWKASRHDLADATHARYAAQLAHAIERWGTRPVESITHDQISEWIGELVAANVKPAYVGKIVRALGMVLGYAGISPNPVRDERVRLPMVRRADVDAPETDVLEASFAAMPARYVLACLVLEATAMRVSELEHLLWADVDAAHGRLRVNIGTAKTRAGGRWVPVPDEVMQAIEAIKPREDRNLDARVFTGLDQAALRAAIRRAVTATGTARWSPHGLRRRRISLWHRSGVSWAQIGEWAGQRDLSVTANVYSRVMVGAELERSKWLGGTKRGASVAHSETIGAEN